MKRTKTQLTISEMMTDVTFTAPLVVDGFAGGGGASTGMEAALGRPVSVAINHDESAILMHQMNHPHTLHYKDNIWMIDPKEVTGGRPVGLAWFSPDCKHFSRAKGAALVDRNIRGLAWVVVKWAALARPAVIMMENVPEFVTWGPVRKGKPVKKKAGQTFARWKQQLEDLGYVIEYRELCAADYGAPTIRTRFCLVARCDGRPIVWPKPTHAPRNSEAVRSGKLLPWRSAAEVIDWSLPTYSIFASKQELKEKYGINAIRPLANNTQARIACGLDKFVISNDEPFIMCNNAQNQPHRLTDPVPTITTGNRNYLCLPQMKPFAIDCNHTGGGHITDLKKPLGTVTAKCTTGIVAPYLSQYHSQKAGESRAQDIRHPIMTVDTSNRYSLISPYLTEYFGNGQPVDVRDPLHTVTTRDRECLTSVYVDKYFGGGYSGCGNSVREPFTTATAEPRHSLIVSHLSKFFSGVVGADIKEPLPTVTAVDHNALCISHLAHFKGKDKGQSPRDPLMTVTASDGQFGEIRAVVVKYDGQQNLGYWPQVREMLNRYTKWCIYDDEILLLRIGGAWYFISDVCLRMLTPRELYSAMGFPANYIIDVDNMGRAISRKDQVARCGNAVPPPLAAAMVRANLPEWCMAA